MRRVLSTAVVALVVAALVGVPMGAVAQSDPADDRISPSALVRGLNADKIDGKHASRYTLSRRPRAKKVVATNRLGMLPPNIIEPYWRLIQNKPAILADNQIHWDEVVGKPSTLPGMITATIPCANPVPAWGNQIVLPPAPREAMYDFDILPHTVPGIDFWIDASPDVQVLADGRLQFTLNYWASAAGGFCNIRASALVHEGITPAGAKKIRKVFDKSKVKYKKGGRPRR